MTMPHPLYFTTNGTALVVLLLNPVATYYHITSFQQCLPDLYETTSTETYTIIKNKIYA